MSQKAKGVAALLGCATPSAVLLFYYIQRALLILKWPPLYNDNAKQC